MKSIVQKIDRNKVRVTKTTEYIFSKEQLLQRKDSLQEAIEQLQSELNEINGRLALIEQE